MFLCYEQSIHALDGSLYTKLLFLRMQKYAVYMQKYAMECKSTLWNAKVRYAMRKYAMQYESTLCNTKVRNYIKELSDSKMNGIATYKNKWCTLVFCIM